MQWKKRSHLWKERESRWKHSVTTLAQQRKVNRVPAGDRPTDGDCLAVWNLQEVGVRDEDGCRRAVGSSVYEVILYTPIGHKGLP